MTQRVCRVGTRKSALARTQTGWVVEHLEKSGIACKQIDILSEGDVDKISPLYELESEAPGLFCKQLEQALLEGRIDLAVHSLKDLPTVQPKDLEVLAIPARATARDCLLIHPASVDSTAVLQLTGGARVGTSSLRREAQFLAVRPDLRVEPIRGNVPSRIDQVRSGKLGAAVLACAGIERLSADLSGVIRVDLPLTDFVSAPGQGALAVEGRTDCPAEWTAAVRRLHDEDTATNVRIERAILRGMNGGCTLPLGVHCEGAGREGRRVMAFLGQARNRGEGRRDWVAFHRFDICDVDEETLVSKTVGYLKERVSAGE